MQLSKNFNLSEFTESATAKREGIRNVPTENQTRNLQGLANDFLQPLRDHFKKPIKITSGYRSKALNEAVGGATNSYHRCLGRKAAADFKVVGVPIGEVFDYLKASNLPYEQIIYEFGRWIHISYSLPKREALKASKINGKTVYKPA